MTSASRSLVIDNIGSLITNDPELGTGPLGIVEQASVVITDGIVEEVGPAGAVADRPRSRVAVQVATVRHQAPRSEREVAHRIDAAVISV